MSVTGTVKSFNPMKNFGFITYEGGEVFVHLSDCKGGMPKEGDTVTFDLEDSQKKAGSKKASNVVGGTGAIKGVMGSGSCQGTVKSFNPVKGWGFITYEGADIFCHIKDCQGGMPVAGDTVAFDLEDSPAKAGTKKAANVTGGSADLQQGGGKGGWGMMGGYGPMMGMKGGWGGMSGPYGKGGGKGWGMPMMMGWY